MEELAAVGHAVIDGRIYDALAELQTPIRHPVARPILDLIAAHHEQHRRHPSPAEIVAKISDPATKAAYMRALDYQVSIAWETLIPSIGLLAERTSMADNWGEITARLNRSVALSDRGGIMEGAEAHREGVAGLRQLVADLDRIEAVAAGQRFRSMPDRMSGLAQDLAARTGSVIPTGVTYLDDVAGGGIGKNDLWILSATTGSGKTQIMIEIARHAARAGKRVAFFALEADDREMEARILFSALVSLYGKSHPGRFVDRARWLHGDPDTHRALAPFLADAEYLGFGKYKATDLERDVLARRKDSDLIVIDHLGYVALDGENENKETTDLLFLLRDLVKLGRGVPIITACHTRKSNTPKKFATLIPGREDIKGSGAIIQCATAVVMIGKVYEPVADVNGAALEYPTIIQMQKDRRDGRDFYAAVCDFVPRLGSYAKEYALGRMTKGDTGWLPVPKNPYRTGWAARATLDLRPFGAEASKGAS
jgi:hypothetical protein